VRSCTGAATMQRSGTSERAAWASESTQTAVESRRGGAWVHRTRGTLPAPVNVSVSNPKVGMVHRSPSVSPHQRQPLRSRARRMRHEATQPRARASVADQAT
jgi:hypothetical protein